MHISIMPDKLQMGKAAATAGAKLIREAIAARGDANIIVATGASQFEMLAALAAEPDVAWHRVTGFHLDEYVGLSITHPASFRGYLWQRFVSRLPLPLRDFHYLDGEHDPQAECRRVGNLIRQHPIDVAFVGIGENGHLAFNDPPANFETEEPYLVVELDEACRRQQLGEGWFPTFVDVPRQAISMSVRQILKSRAIICTVPDERKAAAVRGAVEGEITPQVPASILQRHGRATIYLDPLAASQLQLKHS
jgi:glucosamine-6-phosphate deaminase